MHEEAIHWMDVFPPSFSNIPFHIWINCAFVSKVLKSLEHKLISVPLRNPILLPTKNLPPIIIAICTLMKIGTISD